MEYIPILVHRLELVKCPCGKAHRAYTHALNSLWLGPEWSILLPRSIWISTSLYLHSYQAGLAVFGDHKGSRAVQVVWGLFTTVTPPFRSQHEFLMAGSILVHGFGLNTQHELPHQNCCQYSELSTSRGNLIFKAQVQYVRSIYRKSSPCLHYWLPIPGQLLTLVQLALPGLAFHQSLQAETALKCLVNCVTSGF